MATQALCICSYVNANVCVRESERAGASHSPSLLSPRATCIAPIVCTRDRLSCVCVSVCLSVCVMLGCVCSLTLLMGRQGSQRTALARAKNGQRERKEVKKKGTQKEANKREKMTKNDGRKVGVGVTLRAKTERKLSFLTVA